MCYKKNVGSHHSVQIKCSIKQHYVYYIVLCDYVILEGVGIILQQGLIPQSHMQPNPMRSRCKQKFVHLALHRTVLALRSHWGRIGRTTVTLGSHSSHHTIFGHISVLECSKYRCDQNALTALELRSYCPRNGLNSLEVHSPRSH